MMRHYLQAIAALVRASAVSASSYRLAFVMSMLGLASIIVPLYFISTSLQPVMAASISNEGRDYFAFVLIGMIVITVVPVVLNAPAASIASGISSGSLESLLATPTPLPITIFGTMGYGFGLALARATLLAVVGVILGVRFAAPSFLLGLAVYIIILVSYLAIGTIAAAMIVAFRTSGPLITLVIGASTLLGGVYFPSKVIPSWLVHLADVVPLSYGLRALRRLWLDGASIVDVAMDVTVLVTLTAVLCALAAAAFSLALRDARKRGSLGQY